MGNSESLRPHHSPLLTVVCQLESLKEWKHYVGHGQQGCEDRMFADLELYLWFELVYIAVEECFELGAMQEEHEMKPLVSFDGSFYW